MNTLKLVTVIDKKNHIIQRVPRMLLEKMVALGYEPTTKGKYKAQLKQQNQRNSKLK